MAAVNVRLTLGAAAAGYLLWKGWQSLAVPVCVEGEGLTVFKWFFSPPARLVHVTTLLSKAPATFHEIDLSLGHQLQWWFLRVNPAHQVPACVEGGQFMAESRDLARHIFEKYNKDPANDHWYPRDPARRRAVDEWMDWSKPLHLCIETQVALRLAATLGMPWRDNYGIVPVLVGSLVDPPGGRESLLASKLREHLDDAERIISKRSIGGVADLNLGDLTTVQEVCMAFECFEGTNEIIPSSTSLWKEYPHLAHLYDVFQGVPEFTAVHAPFLAFCKRYRQVRGLKDTPLTKARGVLTTFASFLPYAIWNAVLAKLYPFGPRQRQR